MNERYSRQILFDGIGEEGQRRLLGARAAIIGCGALGTAQAEALARAGVGRLRIVDRDFVEASNLQRQTMFTERDARERLPKAVACVKHGVVWIYGAAVGSYGVTMTVRPRVTPCLRCVFEEAPAAGSAPTCDTEGVIMPIIS